VIELTGTQAIAYEATLNQFCEWLRIYQEKEGKSPAEITMGLSILAKDMNTTMRTIMSLGLGVINAKLLNDGTINNEDVFSALGIKNPVSGGLEHAGVIEGSTADPGRVVDSSTDDGDASSVEKNPSSDARVPGQSDSGDA
jgi:hypothetical protein